VPPFSENKEIKRVAIEVCKYNVTKPEIYQIDHLKRKEKTDATPASFTFQRTCRCKGNVIGVSNIQTSD
jgi:hypothetical protein